jgi:predicted AlkP superfamily pyrophosphatase or phosphodiesterase
MSRMIERNSNRQPLRLSLILLLVCTLLFSSIAASQQRAPQSAAAQSGLGTKRPRLVLLIAVDQFRYDYLERFGDLFVQNGLRRLLRNGASWVDSNYDHMPTYTAPGHSTMMTGAYPAESGIIANEWPDRSSGKKVSSVSDDSVKLLGGKQNENGASPRRLMTSTLGDELRLVTNDRAKVLGISVKDRSAILPAGRHANAAYWFSGGSMVSSTYYFDELPGWVTGFNRTRPADKYFGAKWERLLPESEYLKRAGVDSPTWEDIGRVPGDTNAFPHTVTGGATGPGREFYNALDYSPFTNDLLVSFARQAIINEQLGQDNDTDLLSVSFSANDYVGHRYGPYSQEAMDISLRVDRQIATLLDFVQRSVGLANTIVVFTADHGVAPIPEHAAALGLGGVRLKADDVLTAIRSAISSHYNPHATAPDPTTDYIYRYDDNGTSKDAFINGNVYFNYAALKRDGVSLDEIEELAGEAALTVPGIARYFTRAQLQRGATSVSDPIARRASHGFYPGRSGDLVVVPDPFKYLGDSITATHGSPYSYDTHVPLIIMGAGLHPGRYFEAASPADIAPTLSALLGLQAPSSTTGRILLEAIKRRDQLATSARF